MQTLAQKRLLQSHIARHVLREQRIRKPVKKTGWVSVVYKFIRSFVLVAVLMKEVS